MPSHSASLTLVLLLAATPAFADAVPAAQADTGTIIHLVEQVERQLPRDRLNAVMRVETKGLKPADVQAEVNRRMQAALDRAKAVNAVKVSSGSYSVYRQPPPPTNATAPDTWIASQTMMITAQDFAPALTLIGDLQGTGLVIQSLAFEVSPEALHAAQDGMSDAALAALRLRAEHVAATLGMTVARYKSIDVGNVTTQEPPLPRFRMMAAAAASAPPAAAEAGDATAALTVDAQVELEPRK